MKQGAMHEYGGEANGSDDRPSHDAASVAQSINKDFRELAALFDRQLMGEREVGYKNGVAILEARAAVERGLQLSKQLFELLRATDSKN